MLLYFNKFLTQIKLIPYHNAEYIYCINDNKYFFIYNIYIICSDAYSADTDMIK